MCLDILVGVLCHLGMSLCVVVIVKSSAYDIMFLFPGIGGVSCK